MDWMKIGSAILIIVFIFMIYPRVKHQLKHGEKGSQQEWLGAFGLLAGVALFVWFLMASM